MSAQTMLLQMLRPIRATRGRFTIIARAMNASAGWCYIIVAAFITADVGSRQFLGFSSGSTTEVAGYVLACGITWGLAHTMLERAHIRIDILVMRTPLRLRQYLHVLSLTLLLVFIGLMTWSGFDLAAESMLFGSTDLSAFTIPLAPPQMIWTFGLGAFAALLVVMLAETLLLLLLGDAAGVDSLLAHHFLEQEGETAAHEPVIEGRGAP
jgi:TRAP-type C4-dicarboxylate transport system permease small subunit